MFQYEITHKYLKNDYQIFDALKTKDLKTKTTLKTQTGHQTSKERVQMTRRLMQASVDESLDECKQMQTSVDESLDECR